MRWRLGLLGATALLARCLPAAAQTLEELRGLSIEQLGQIEVSSVAKTEQPLSDAPAAVFVISHQDIIRSGATTLPEILRLAPNLEVAQINAQSYAISARGFNVSSNASFSNKLLIMVDGRSVYSPMFGGIYWDMQGVPPESIDRIEVISGPGAALWGANAVNGVINIITLPSAKTQGGVLTVGAGNLQRNASLQYSGRLAPNLTYRLHAEYSDFSSYPLTNGHSARDGWSKPQGGFRLDWTPGNDNLSLQGDIFTAEQLPNGFVRGHNLLGSWRHEFQDGSSVQVLGYYDNAERTVNNGNAFWIDTYHVELQHNFSLGSWNDIVWGVGERRFSYRFVNTAGLRLVPDHQTLNFANIFAQDTIALTPRLKLTLGVKLEDEPYAGMQVMPNVRLAWKPVDQVLLWGAVSRAVRSPTPVDANLQEWVGPLDILNGSHAFRPETLTAYEVGTRVQAAPRLSFSVSGFYNVYDDLRSIDPGGRPGGPFYVFGNNMDGEVYGVEVWGSWQVTDWWRLTAGFNLQHEDLRFLPGSSRVAGLAFVADDPNQQAQLRSSVNFGGGVTWDAFLREVGELHHPRVPGYVELNMRLGWDVTHWLNLSLNGFNLLHARHLEFVAGVPGTEVPRSVYAQARLRF